jgi:flavin reductase (DIM6/NTAB) family NADH-FMN oxidoreductase RutF
MDETLKGQIVRPLGMIPSGCFVLTATDSGLSQGILASWVQQAGFDPPAVSVAVKHSRPIRSLIDRSGHFVLNMVGQDAEAMLKHFGKGFETDQEAFEGMKTRSEPGGVVLEDCIAHLNCRVTGHVDAGDHTVYVATVIGGGLHRDGQPCVRIRTNGFNY